MRSAILVALAIAGLTVAGWAQAEHRPKGKPSHAAERDANQKKPRVGKAVTGDHASSDRTPAAQELRRVEQSSRKVPPERKGDRSKAPLNSEMKGQKKDGNPPIHFGASGGGHKSSGKSSDELKGRIKHKGHR